jgi:hypothetical protein
VTSLAGNGCVLSGQVESSQGVVEGPILPIAGIVAGSAFCPKATAVLVVLLVTGKTCCGRIYKKHIHMALVAGYSNV